MKHFLLATLVTIGAAFAQPAVAPPQIGFVQDADNALRPVYGIAGNFVLGDALATGVNAAAYSGSFGMVKMDSSLLAIDRQGNIIASADAPSGGAMFAFTSTGAPSFVYLTDAQAWVIWDGQSFQPAAYHLSAFGTFTIVSISSPRDGEGQIILQRADGLWDVRILLADGEITSQTAVTGIAAPLLALATGDTVYQDPDGIVLRNTDGSEKHIAAQLPANFSLRQMGNGWIQIRDVDTLNQYAVRITENREQFYFLPGDGQ